MTKSNVASAIVITFLSWACWSARAFSVAPRLPTQQQRSSGRRTARRAGAVLDLVEPSVATDTTDIVDVYDRLGIERENLALGVKPDEVLKYIGTREDLIQKTLTDLPKLDRPQAETKVDQFLLDAEMIDLYIRFGKELEKDPNFVVPETEEPKEGLFSFRTVIIAYIGYIGFGIVKNVFRGYVANQEIAGTWQGTNIGFLDDWIQQTSPAATQLALQRAAEAAQAAATQASSAVLESLVQTNDLLLM